MDDVPGWIQLLYTRMNAWHALHTAFLHELTKSHLAELAQLYPDGHPQLRRFALGELASDDPEVVALSLVFLSVVGEAQDLPTVAHLVAHPSDLIQRAAKACQFALKRVTRL